MTIVALVEDDDDLRGALAAYLRSRGCQVHEFAHGNDLPLVGFEAVVLDICLPGEDGLSIARRMRERSDAGILILTGIADVSDCIAALELGADDYMIKPCEPRELLARIRAVVRRRQPHSEPGQAPAAVAWTLSERERKVTMPSGRAVTLSTAEFALLRVLFERAGHAVSRDQLSLALKGHPWNPDDRTIDVHISHLRRKLGAESIRTDHGKGYALVLTIP